MQPSRVRGSRRRASLAAASDLEGGLHARRFAYQDLFAIQEQTGDGQRLRIGGTVVFRNAGWTTALLLFTGDANFGINPFNLFLELVFTPPPEGPTLPEVLTPTEIDPFEIDPVLRYREVYFQVVGTLDEPPPPLTIDHRTDPGACQTHPARRRERPGRVRAQCNMTRRGARRAVGTSSRG